MFVEDLKEYIQKEKLKNEQIYNADETSLFWKCLPPCSLASGSEHFMEGSKESKERLTALLCANAAGTHKCKLMIIGKSAKPRALKNVQNLPVVYKSNKKAWVTQQVFLEWFNNHFVPEVREHVERNGLERNCKILLLLDNCPAHPDVSEMMSENVVVKYIPPNCTSLIQPMDQGVIRSFKCNYRKSIVQKLLCAGNRHEFVKSINIKIAIWIAAVSWDAVSGQVLHNGWSNLLAFEDAVSDRPEIQSDIEIPFNCSPDDISEWIEYDTDVVPFAILSDNEIVSMVSQAEENDNSTSSEDEETEIETPTLAQAIEACNILLKFVENSPVISEPDKIQMHRIQNQLLREKLEEEMQKQISLLVSLQEKQKTL